MPTTSLKPLKRKIDSVQMIVRRDSLHPAPFNPEIRTRRRYLLPLIRSMEEYGFIEWEHIKVDRTAMIVDGHRRWTAAGILKIEEVPIIMIDADASEMWMVMNSTRAQVTPAQFLQAFSNGMVDLPDSMKSRIEGLTDLLGPEGIALLGEKGISPHIYKKVIKVARYVGKMDDEDFMRKTLWWMVAHPRAQANVDRAIRDYVDGGVIISAVEADVPLILSYRGA